MDISDLTRRVRELVASGHSTEEAVALLRGAGCSKGQSVLLLAEATSMDMAAATRAVGDSQTWSDRRDRDAALNDELWDRLEREGDLQPDGSIDITDWLNADPEAHR